MEVEEIQAQACNNNGNNSKLSRNKLGQKGGHDHHYPDDEDRVGDQIKRPNTGPTAALIDPGNINNNGGGNRLRGWQQSSRIIRVSRASGGKDRHSKVWTSKGLRDRRVRLSVTTAIQFYDLQDRLGYDQPSKAVEWLINAASEAIADLPSLNSSFPVTPKQLSDEKRASVGTEQGFDSAEVELELDQGEANYQQQNQHLSLSKSACSSTSETSKGSGLSLSRSDIRVNRVKARERARERAAKEKEKENSDSRILHHHHHHQNMNPISHNANSFTELLTGGISNVNSSSNNNNNDSSSPTTASEPNIFAKASAAGTTTTAAAAAMQMDYFTTGLLGLSSAAGPRNHHSSGFAGIPMSMQIPQPFGIISGGGDSHAAAAAAAADAMPHFSFVPEQLIAAASSQPNGNGGDYSLNFSISSSGLAGFNRGTLQSNSSPSSLLPHFQRLASPIDGTTNVPFFIGAAATAAAASPMENHHHHHHHHHQFPAGFDGRLQLYYGDGSRHSDQKGKGKN